MEFPNFVEGRTNPAENGHREHYSPRPSQGRVEVCSRLLLPEQAFLTLSSDTTHKVCAFNEYRKHREVSAPNNNCRRIASARLLSRKSSYLNQAPIEVEKVTIEPSKPQASITTYDSRLLVGDSALLVPISSRASSLRVEMIQGSDSEDSRPQTSGFNKRAQPKEYKAGSVKKMKKERPAVKTNHVKG